VVNFSPNGNKVASTLEDEVNGIRIWDVETGETQHVFRCRPLGIIRYAVFSPNGTTLAAVDMSMDQMAIVMLWDTETGYLKHSLRGHSILISCISFSLDGKILAAASGFEVIQLWDVATGELRRVIRFKATCYSLSFHDNDTHILTDFGTMRIDSSGDENPDTEPRAADFVGYGLSEDDGWITWNGQNVIWLPTEYRRDDFDPADGAERSVLSGFNVALVGKPGGRIIFIRFSSTHTPEL
jgi:WD40 repeat protein